MTHPIVAQARTYRGTPFRHRGRGPRRLDCAGLVWRVYADLGTALPDVLHYGTEPWKDGLQAAVVAALGPAIDREGMQAGDVVVMGFDNPVPHHIGILGDYPYGGLSLIHTYGFPGPEMVTEHRLDDTWRARILSVHRRQA